MVALNKPIHRITKDPFFGYGPDRDRRFVASLEPGDLLSLRPLRSRESRKVSVRLADVYRWALLCQANAKRLEKARAAKAKKAARLQTMRLARAVAKHEQASSGETPR